MCAGTLRGPNDVSLHFKTPIGGVATFIRKRGSVLRVLNVSYGSGPEGLGGIDTARNCGGGLWVYDFAILVKIAVVMLRWPAPPRFIMGMINH